MNNSSGPRSRASNLPESLNQQLNMYALAASAAGVGLLALSPPAEAKIVYTPANIHILVNTGFSLDVNHDGITDFVFSNSGECCSMGQFVAKFYVSAASGIPNQLVVSNDCAVGIRAGKRIGPARHFGGDRYFMAYYNGSSVVCPWTNQKTAFLGLKFMINGQVH